MQAGNMEMKTGNMEIQAGNLEMKVNSCSWSNFSCKKDVIFITISQVILAGQKLKGYFHAMY